MRGLVLKRKQELSPWHLSMYCGGCRIRRVDNNVKSNLIVRKPSWQRIVLCIAVIAVLTALPYAQVWHHEYVYLDDYEYIVHNNYINRGLTMDGLLWAMNFHQSDGSYWRPITWMSHMLDFALFGRNSSAHHMVNVIFHALNAILVYLLIDFMTKKSVPSLFIALLFGLHPLNVESVAWLTERSNVLSTFWGLIALLCYRRYTIRKTYPSYGLVVIFFLLSLMSKPLLITLPFLMLLMDYWPLERVKALKGQSRSAAGLVIEKIPLIALAFTSVYLAMARVGDETISVSQVAFSLRAANAFVSYIQYLLKFFHPVELAAFYPFPQSIAAWKSFGAFAMIATISVLLFLRAKKMPYVFVGWFWYVGTLLPKIGFIQAGLWPAWADRWIYFPGIGISIMIVWPLGRWLREHRKPMMQRCGIAAGAGSLFILTYLTWMQVGVWSDSQTLFDNMLKHTQNNYFAHNNIGFLLSTQGQNHAAEEHFRKAIDFNPRYEKAYFNMGVIMSDRGNESDAAAYFRKAVALKPTSVLNNLALGKTLVNQSRKEGLKYLSTAVHLSRNSAEVHNIVKAILRDAGRTRHQNPLVSNP